MSLSSANITSSFSFPLSFSSLVLQRATFLTFKMRLLDLLVYAASFAGLGLGQTLGNYTNGTTGATFTNPILDATGADP
jgi:hypothetical protein